MFDMSVPNFLILVNAINKEKKKKCALNIFIEKKSILNNIDKKHIWRRIVLIMILSKSKSQIKIMNMIFKTLCFTALINFGIGLQWYTQKVSFRGFKTTDSPIHKWSKKCCLMKFMIFLYKNIIVWRLPYYTFYVRS